MERFKSNALSQVKVVGFYIVLRYASGIPLHIPILVIKLYKFYCYRHVENQIDSEYANKFHLKCQRKLVDANVVATT